ncbi:MAG: UDP-N-acetylmuramate dehydrogenase [Prevotellaceae bacterium]|nr:UDP-N-acetylmuramate dehydrogenase [Prevotellaceae bacterium]
MKTFDNYSLRAHNTFGIEARARRFAEYDSIDGLRRLLGEPFLHIGAGSNLLFTKDYDGLVLHSAIHGTEVIAEAADHVVVRAGAAEVFDDFVARCVECGWHGLENLSLIPGEVGAAAVQNIGAYGAEVSACIDSVEAVETATGREVLLPRADCRYAYRSSIFKSARRGELVVTYVRFRLSKRFVPDLQYAALRRHVEADGLSPEAVSPQYLRRAVIAMRESKLPDPRVTGSAGSFFINPVVSAEKAGLLARDFPEMPTYVVEDGVKLSAAWLIDRCGLKGFSVGGASVYERQPLVLVNRDGTATGADVLALSRHVQREVLARFGVTLTPEVNIL